MGKGLPELLAAALVLATVSGSVALASSAETGIPGGSAVTPASLAANATTSVSILDDCVEVSSGSTFTLDIHVEEVPPLIAWEMFFVYDRSLLEVAAKDVRIFLSVASGSNVIDVSDPTPNTSGLHRIAAADIAIPAAPETGSGILATLTLNAKAPGFTSVGLPSIDLNGDGLPDMAPRLVGLNASAIGDANGDDYLDEPIEPSLIAIDRSCENLPVVLPELPLPPLLSTPTPSDSGSEPSAEGGGATTGSDETAGAEGSDEAVGAVDTSTDDDGGEADETVAGSASGTDDDEEASTRETPDPEGQEEGPPPSTADSNGGPTLWIVGFAAALFAGGAATLLLALRAFRKRPL